MLDRLKYLTLLLLVPGILAASELYTGSFLELGVGTRQAAMGNTGGILTGDATAFYWHPSAIAVCKMKNIQLMHNWLFDGLASHD